MAAFEFLRPERPHGPFPVPTGSWAPFLLALRAQGQGVDAQARALEAAGASPEELAGHLMDLFYGAFPRFRGLSRGFSSREKLDPGDAELGLWVLSTLHQPWRVLEVLGTNPMNILRYLLSTWTPSVWMVELELLHLPDTIRRTIRLDGVTLEGNEGEVDLGWLPSRIQGDLRLQGPLRLTGEFGPFVLLGMGVLRFPHGLRVLHRVSAKSLLVEDASDLTAITLDARTPTIIRRCPSLLRIHGSVGADLRIEDCPSLRTLDILLPRDSVPAPSLAVVQCPSLKWVGRLAAQRRVLKDLTLLDNPALLGVRQPLTRRGHLQVRGCPLLEAAPWG